MIVLVSIGGIGAAVWQGQLTASLAVPFGAGAMAALVVALRVGRRLRPATLRAAFGLLALAAAAMLLAKLAAIALK